jgi:hypothetical protein
VGGAGGCDPTGCKSVYVEIFNHVAWLVMMYQLWLKKLPQKFFIKIKIIYAIVAPL